MTSHVPAISLDQFHWIGLARAVRARGSAESTYVRILDVAMELREAGKVRFPLTADRYYETIRTSQPHQRIDVAMAMKLLSGYETMLQLDLLTSLEIGVAVSGLPSGETSVPPIEVFGHGAMHAFGGRTFTDGLRINSRGGPIDGDLLEQLRAAVKELYQPDFEWACLSGDPRVAPVDVRIRETYDRRRMQFAKVEQDRLRIVHGSALDPHKAAYGFAAMLHVDSVIQQAQTHGVDMDLVPLDDGLIGFIQQVPTVHVLAELLTGQYRNQQTKWKDGDWADLRTLCQAVVYCDVVAPDNKWADAVRRSSLPAVYDTVVLAGARRLLTFLEELAQI